MKSFLNLCHINRYLGKLWETVPCVGVHHHLEPGFFARIPKLEWPIYCINKYNITIVINVQWYIYFYLHKAYEATKTTAGKKENTDFI